MRETEQKKGSRKMDYSQLREKIEDMKEEIIGGIQDAIRIDSVGGIPEENAPYGAGPKKALDFALNLGKSMGFRTGNIDNKAGYVEMGDGEEMVAVLGHLDVVPVGDDWKYPPFGAEIHDGILYGRGVADDKGPTIGAIYAMKAIQELQIPLDRRIRVIFGTNEERGCDCIKHYVEKGEELPVMGITPDAEYPMIFFEKGMTTMVGGYENPVQGDIKVLEFHGGTAGNIVPLHCRLVLEGTYEIPETEGVTITAKNGKTIIEAEGVSAHGSRPELGLNAIIRLLQAVKGLKIGGDFQKFADFLVSRIGTETNGKTLGICYEDAETGETTVNLGIVDYTAERLLWNLDIRYPKNGKKEEVYDRLKEVMDLYGMQVMEHRTTDMLYVPKDSELVQKLMHVYREGTGENPEPKAIGGGTYAKMFQNMVAFGPMFPGEPDIAHQPNEYMEISKLIQSIQLTAAAAVEMARK